MWYNEDIKTLFSKLDTSPDGISDAEAENRLKEKGRNELKAAEKKGILSRFFEALCDRMTVVLLVAAAISCATSFVSGEGFADPLIILLIVIINAVIAVFQESRAEKALEALKRMTSPETAVIRDGKIKRIPSAEIAYGDVFVLEKGDIVPCDARLIDSNELVSDESSLTGESVGVAKDHRDKPTDGSPISEITNSVFTSSHIISGRGKAVAVRTGMETCVGEIAGMISAEEEKTPLQKRLAGLSSLLGNVTIAICALIFVFSLLKGMDAGEMFMTSVSLSVAAIP